MRIAGILFFYSSANIIIIIIMLRLFSAPEFYELNTSFHRVTWFLCYCSRRFCWLNLKTTTIILRNICKEAYNFDFFRANIQIYKRYFYKSDLITIYTPFQK